VYKYFVNLRYVLDFQCQVLIVRIFSVSVFRLWVKGPAVFITSAVLFPLLISIISDLLKSTFLSVMVGRSQYKIIMLKVILGQNYTKTVVSTNFTVSPCILIH